MNTSQLFVVYITPFALISFVSAIIVFSKLDSNDYKEIIKNREMVFFIKNFHPDDKVFTYALNIFRVSFLLALLIGISFSIIDRQ